jgi:twinkle protein
MIDQSCIEQIKSTAVAFDVINSLLPLKKVGNDWAACCPFHNEKSPSFKVSKTKNIFKCFGCGVFGDSIEFLMKYKELVYLDAIKWLAEFYKIALIEEKKDKPKVFTKPVLKNGQISAQWLQWFGLRGISGRTLETFKISMENTWMPGAQKNTDAICFPYYRNGELINVKYRAENKDFKLSKDAELIFYNLDSLKDNKIVIIVEGEIDALSVYECGVDDAAIVSVPNGVTKNGNINLDYMNNCYEAFKHVSEIILFTDNDECGLRLRNELAGRFGMDKCFKIDFPKECKDANDILVKHGKEKLFKIIESASEFPIEGVFSMAEMVNDVRDYYKNGYPGGIKVGIPGFDDHLQLSLNQLTMITGIPGHGKSEFVDYLITEAARNFNWNFAVCSFENQPSSLHVTKIMEKFVGKSFAKRYDDNDRINAKEFENAIAFIDNHFFFINISKINVTLQGILDKAKELILRKGIKCLLIDPWNYIEHKYGKVSETQYISDCLTLMKAFATIHNIHIILVAHPSKMPKVNNKYEIPTLYHISGSAHFFNKTDNGITIYRNYDTKTVDVHVQKVKHSWLGKIGVCSFTYNTETRQYEPIIRGKEIAPEPQKIPFETPKGYQPYNSNSIIEGNVNWDNP